MGKPKAVPREISEINFPVIAIGGLGTGPECEFLYRRIIDDGQDWGVSPKERFIPIPKRGLGDHVETLKKVEDRILSLVQALGSKAIVVGHSYGGLLATETVLDHPQAAKDAVLVAGVHNGKRIETPESLAIRGFLTMIPGTHFLETPEDAKNIHYNSPFMTRHKERIATEWPAEVDLHAIATAYDTLLPVLHGMNIKMPEGQKANESVIALPVPGAQELLRLLTRNPQIRHIKSNRPAIHIDIVRHPSLVKYVRNLQAGKKAHIDPPNSTEVWTLTTKDDLPDAA